MKVRSLVLVCVAILIAGCQVGEPTEESKPTSETNEAVLALARRLEDEEADVRSRAAYALAKSGSFAKPVVAALARAVHDDNHEVQSNAASALSAIGPDAEPAIPDLIQMLGGDGYWVFAKEALEAIGPNAIPALVNALESDNPHLRSRAAEALGEILKDIAEGRTSKVSYG